MLFIKTGSMLKNVEPFVSQITRGEEDDFTKVIQKSLELFLQEKRPTFILALVNSAVIKKHRNPLHCNR